MPFVLSAKLQKNRALCNFETKSAQDFLPVNFNCGSIFVISNITFMINKLDLLWLPNFIALGIYFAFRTKYLPGIRGLILVVMSNACYLAVILIFLVVIWWFCSLPSGYCSLLLVTWWLLLVTWWLLVVTARYCLLLLVTTLSMNVPHLHFDMYALA